MIALQIFDVGGSRKRPTPGPSRGDMVLTQDAVPRTIGDWKQVSFTPAPPPEELPAGQYWWVHQWQYQKDGTTALVSFDQLGEDQWHELTYCYRNLDWTIRSRTEYEDRDGGSYIVAELRKDSGEVALLVFSVFFEDGTWATPPAVDLARLNRKRATGVLENAMQRIGPDKLASADFASTSRGHNRAIQCQVLVTSSDSDVRAELDSAIQLHLESRQRFRSLWLDDKPSPLTIR